MDYREIMWAEQKVDIYSGEKCDKHEPFWHGYADGDMEDGEIENPITLEVKRFPPGTKIVISVPVCPKCGMDREFAFQSKTPQQCECGFSWKEWDEEQYS